MFELLSNSWFLVVMLIAIVTFPPVERWDRERRERRRVELERRAGGLILRD